MTKPRIIVGGLRTAAQAAEDRAMLPGKPVPPVLTPAEFEPAPPDNVVAARLRINGNQHALCSDQIRHETRAKIGVLRRTWPHGGEKIESLRSAAQSAAATFYNEVEKLHAIFGEVKSNLIKRAGLRLEIEAKRRLLSEATDMLEDAAATTWTEEKLFKLHLTKTRLPEEIAASEKEQATLSETIQAALVIHEIDPADVIEELRREARDPAGRVIDQEARRLEQFLPL